MGRGRWGGGFAPYVSKAEKQRRAARACAALEKNGRKLEPVILEGRVISRTWWGKAWAENLERYADYSNRIPRGRTYVRSGSVLDLKIEPNKVCAIVSGSRSQPYKVTIGIQSLNKKLETSLMRKSSASLHSMHDLLAGKFPEELKGEFFEKNSGLFPSPREIQLDCSCPDWAEMCKHVAAALYGVAARLDRKPELFFVLRGIDMERFVGETLKHESTKMLKKARVKSERVISGDDTDMAALFGIEMDSVSSAAQQPAKTSGDAAKKPAAKGALTRKATQKRTGANKAAVKKAAQTAKKTAVQKVDLKRNAAKKGAPKKTKRKVVRAGAKRN